MPLLFIRATNLALKSTCTRSIWFWELLFTIKLHIIILTNLQVIEYDILLYEYIAQDGLLKTIKLTTNLKVGIISNPDFLLSDWFTLVPAFGVVITWMFHSRIIRANSSCIVIGTIKGNLSVLIAFVSVYCGIKAVRSYKNYMERNSLEY